MQIYKLRSRFEIYLRINLKQRLAYDLTITDDDFKKKKGRMNQESLNGLSGSLKYHPTLIQTYKL